MDNNTKIKIKELDYTISDFFHKIDEKIIEFNIMKNNTVKYQEIENNDKDLNDIKFMLNKEINDLKNICQWQNIINYGIVFTFLLFILNKIYNYTKNNKKKREQIFTSE